MYPWLLAPKHAGNPGTGIDKAVTLFHATGALRPPGAMGGDCVEDEKSIVQRTPTEGKQEEAGDHHGSPVQCQKAPDPAFEQEGIFQRLGSFP